ncbi:Nodule Cysteine-Rich (NCR) secreted peptide [Medicago truncatula]|uniref:Nodule Cysteine-Rich (NCR) secreted peptide n=1 Tax=Medicago truncatula TaxID=3880 RepID=A0A072V6Q2_MEDTR|nr:Nodule Cysteine-Rich (NCR) secreted peptide [Medicago truncatula]
MTSIVIKYFWALLLYL